MKQILTLLVVTFFFTAVNAATEPFKSPVKINTDKAAVKVSLINAGRVNISFPAVAEETSRTVYEIQKKTGSGEFKTIAILMGESFPTYSFRDKLNITSGTIEYRVVATENNVAVEMVSQDVIVL